MRFLNAEVPNAHASIQKALAQGKKAAAEQAKQRFDQAWAGADVSLTAARM